MSFFFCNFAPDFAKYAFTLNIKTKNMKKSIFLAAWAAMSMTAFAQHSAPVQPNIAGQTLMTINGKAVSAEEFLYIYEKNNQAGALDPKTMDEYLDMFINFKLKVAEAESQGIDTTEAFQKELSGYRAQATPKYLLDEAAMDSLVEMSCVNKIRGVMAHRIIVEIQKLAPSIHYS